MALRFLDSFDHYLTADLLQKYAALTGGPTIVAGAGRRLAALRLGATDTVTGVPLAPATTTAIVGVALKFADAGATGAFLTVLSGSVAQVTLHLSVGFLQARRGDGTVLGTAVSGAVLPGQFYFIELATTIADSGGTVTARYDGAEVLTLTGLDTANGATGWTAVQFSGNGAAIDLDDCYISDSSGAAPWNTFLGDCEVNAVLPTGAGAVTTWTPSAGANYAAVDDPTPNGDVDYTTTSTTGFIDTVAMADAPVPGAALRGVQVLVSTKKTGPGSCLVAPVVRHAGVNQVGTGVDIPATYGYVRQAYQTNPGTGAAWVESDFNAAEFGYARTA